MRVLMFTKYQQVDTRQVHLRAGCAGWAIGWGWEVHDRASF
jgi:hypothetical protein